ncbi:MAG: penicillin-binding protein 2 [Actinomycetota bacterium]|nr:penicillin-binding protein 2 [Actinomycetota bacterium]
MALVQRRIGLLFATFLVLLALGGLRAGWLGVVRADDLARAAATQQVAEVEVPARRGAIEDRTGVQLAVSEPAADIAATPYLVRDPVAAARRLSAPLRIPEGALVRLLSKRDTGFVYLTRALPGQRVRAVERLRLEGIEIVAATRRTYPRGPLAAQLLGTVGTDGRGLSGLEYEHDRRLRGRDGERQLVKDGVGKPISVRDATPAQAGRDLTLSIDAGIQDRVESVLAAVGERYAPKGATAVVMDPRTSEVLAMANWPRVDANDVASAPPYARQNRAVGFTYEPGSTFKAFTVAAALEEDRVEPDTAFTLPPTIQVADRVIGESHPRGTETMTTAQIVAQSSNVGTIGIGLKLGAARFDQWVRRFGFGHPTGVDLPGEEAGIVPARSSYSGSSMGNLPIGQGESVTPLQLATAYSALANDGVLRAPSVVRAVDGRRLALPPGRRVLSRRTAEQVRAMLVGVVRTGGTGSEAAIRGYTLAGKTGTANKVDPETGLYSHARYVASFVGFAPARKPQLLVAVLVDEPKGAIYGGEVAAPAFQAIAQFALPYLGIAPD